MTAFSISIGVLILLCFLYVELSKTSTGVPCPQHSRCDFFVAFLLIGDLVRFYLFNTSRTDALAILTADLSVGNISAVVWTAIAALYLVYIILTNQFRVEWFFRAPYFSISVLLILYVLTTAWSIVPIFTLYRACELVVWVCLSIYFFTRLNSMVGTVIFLALYCTTWISINIATVIDSVSQDVIFSAVKDNFLPAVGFAVAVLGWGTRFRAYFCIVGSSTFVLAGSAAAVPCAIAACFAGLAFNRNIIIKGVGYAGLLSTVSFMIAYLLAPEQFRGIAEVVSNFLQKPPEELLNATGRYMIWSTIWDATKDNYFGSGFGSDRFIQLLGNMTDVSLRFDTPSVFIMSAHDAVLSAWTAAGWLGVVALLFVYVTAVRYIAIGGGADRQSRTMVIVFIILNSLAIPGLAGFFSPIWFTWVAVHAMEPAKEWKGSPNFAIRLRWRKLYRRRLGKVSQRNP